MHRRLSTPSCGAPVPGPVILRPQNESTYFSAVRIKCAIAGCRPHTMGARCNPPLSSQSWDVTWGSRWWFLRLRVPSAASAALLLLLFPPDPPLPSADRSGAWFGEEAGDSLRVCHRWGVHRDSSCDKTVEGYPPLAPLTLSLSHSPANARAFAPCDARCRASIGRRLCPLFIIKAGVCPCDCGRFKFWTGTWSLIQMQMCRGKK